MEAKMFPSWVPFALIFASVSALSFVLVRHLAEGREVRHRYAGVAGSNVSSSKGRTPRTLSITPEQLGLDSLAQKKLRGDLIRAGHFSPHAVVIFTIARTALMLLVPLLTYVFVTTRFGH